MRRCTSRWTHELVSVHELGSDTPGVLVKMLEQVTLDFDALDDGLDHEI